MLILFWEKQRATRSDKQATKSRGDDLSHLHGLEFNLHIVGRKLLLWRHGRVVRRLDNSNLPRISEAAILWTARNYGRVGEGTNFKEFRSFSAPLDSYKNGLWESLTFMGNNESFRLPSQAYKAHLVKKGQSTSQGSLEPMPPLNLILSHTSKIIELFKDKHVISSTSDTSVRAFFAREGGGGNHLPKNFLQVAQILRNSRKEARVIRCTNNGLHMKWNFFFDIWIYMWIKKTLKLKRNSCLFHFDGRRYQWCGPCHCWQQSWHMPFQC